MNPVRESVVEGNSRAFAISKGWMVLKFVSPGRRGPPDRLFIRAGRVIFIEFKRPGEEPTTQQLKVHREMREHGAEVFVIDNERDARAVLA